MEEFREIKNYRNYQVSNLGNIKNILSGKNLKPIINRSNYCLVRLGKSSKLIHRLVCEAFIPNPENKTLVDHKNNNRVDNRVENLRWATPSENSQNRKISSTNKCGYKGIYLCKDTNLYRPEIIHQGKKYRLGYFSHIECC